MVTTEKTRVLYYALGSGAGHLVRALAITRQLRLLSYGECAVMANSRFTPFARTEGIRIIPVEGRRGSLDGAPETLRIIYDLSPNVLVVDTFPQGFFGELVPLLQSIPAKKVFVARASKATPSNLSIYDLVIDAEATDPSHQNAIAVEPIVIRGTAELKGRSEARHLLYCPPEAKLILCLHAGFQGEAENLFRLVAKAAKLVRCEKLALRFLTFDCSLSPELRRFSLSYFPAMELLPAADVIVAAAGYNTFFETKAVGLPTILIPMTRPIDDQFARSSSHTYLARSPQQLLHHLRTLLSTPMEANPPKPIDYQGAIQAATAITQLL